MGAQLKSVINEKHSIFLLLLLVSPTFRLYRFLSSTILFMFLFHSSVDHPPFIEAMLLEVSFTIGIVESKYSRWVQCHSETLISVRIPIFLFFSPELQEICNGSHSNI